MRNTLFHWMKAHKKVEIMLVVSIIIWITLMIVTSYLNSILRLDNQDLSEAFVNIKGKDTIDITQGELLDELYNCTLMQYDSNNPTEHVVLYTMGGKDLFEGEYFELEDFYQAQRLVWYGFCEETSSLDKNNSNTLKKYHNFIVDYGSFICQYDITKVPTDKPFHLVSYQKNSIKTAMRELEKYCSDYGYSYKQLELKVMKTSDFLNKFKWTYLMFFSMILSLQVIDIASAYMYIASLKKVQAVYNLLGLKGYRKNVFILFIIMKLIPLLAGVLLALITCNNIMAGSVIAFYLIEALIITVMIKRKLRNM